MSLENKTSICSKFEQSTMVKNIYYLKSSMHQEEIELKLLESVEQAPNQRSLAQEIGYSLGKINYVLKGLIDKGLVKAENFARSNQKSQYRYLLTDQGIKEKIALTEKFIARKKAEYDALQENLKRYKDQYGAKES